MSFFTLRVYIHQSKFNFSPICPFNCVHNVRGFHNQKLATVKLTTTISQLTNSQLTISLKSLLEPKTVFFFYLFIRSYVCLFVIVPEYYKTFHTRIQYLNIYK